MKRFDNKDIIILLSILALVLIFSSAINHQQSSKKNLNLKDDEKDKILYTVPKGSADELNITTPENKTYYAPMNGYFQATYGFENDEEGSFPDGWIDGGTTTGKTTIINSKDGHNRVMMINDNDGNRITPRQEFNTEQSNGTIEFWVYFGASTFGQSTGFRVENSTGALFINIYADGDNNDEWVYTNGTTPVLTGLSAINEWFHLSIDFCCSGNYKGLSDRTYNFTIRRTDGSVYYESQELNYVNYNNFGNAAILSITSWHNTIRDTWIDAVGYSWDPNYNIGDNFDEGLLLSFNNNTNLNWIGYSLDGQSNRTILGNATILGLFNGHHTIQVFANNSIGSIYASEMVYFTVSMGVGSPTIPGGSNGGNGSNGGQEPEIDLVMIISIIVIGIVVSLSAGSYYKIKKDKMQKVGERIPRKRGKVIGKSGEVTPSKERAEEILAKKTLIHKKEEIVKKKKKMKLSAPLVDVTAVEKKDLEKTESELDIEKQKFICIVHKGPVKGANIYLCPQCETIYCTKCVKALKKKGETCWVCELEFEI